MDAWELVDEYKSKGLGVKAYRSIEAGIKGSFDLGIFFGTFETRGLTSTKDILAKKSCDYSVMVFFDEEKDGSLRQKYDPILLKNVKKITKKEIFEVRDYSIKSIEQILRNIFSVIPISCLHPESHWFVDISGSPIPYFLGLLGFLRDIFPRPKVTIFNPTGHYPEHKEGYSFTRGFDKLIWIPRFWGQPSPALPRTYVFLLGFNGNRSYEVFYKCEPDHTKALVSSPGYEEEYEKEAINRNEHFLKESGLLTEGKEPTVIKSDAANVVDTWKKLEAIVDAERDKSNVIFVPLGPKAHALGCGLSALSDARSSILYHLPRSYEVRDVKRGKFLWKYDITL